MGTWPAGCGCAFGVAGVVWASALDAGRSEGDELVPADCDDWELVAPVEVGVCAGESDWLELCTLVDCESRLGRGCGWKARSAGLPSGPLNGNLKKRGGRGSPLESVSTPVSERLFASFWFCAC